VEPAIIRTAESKIAGCERCRNDESDIPFNFVIADVLEKHGAFDFILSEQGHCPNCRGELSEKTLVEPQGGIEVDFAWNTSTPSWYVAPVCLPSLMTLRQTHWRRPWDVLFGILC